MIVPEGGKHLLIDFWGCSQNTLNNISEIQKILTTSAEICGATVLFSHMHHFGVDCGITGVVLLAESHVSIHTWYETGYCAIDAFMCGSCNPNKMLPALLDYFKPTDCKIRFELRGNFNE